MSNLYTRTTQSFFFFLPHSLLFFFFQIALAILSPFNFGVTFRITINFCKKVSCYFKRECIYSVDQFEEYCHFNNILTILTLLIHELRVSFHLSVSSFSFISDLQFSEYRSFTSSVKFVSRHFIPFDATVSEISFLIHFQIICC